MPLKIIPGDSTTEVSCPRCRSKFIPSRSTQKYCTPECQKAYSRHSARTIRRASGVTEFICVDGEGITIGSDHKYVLMGFGDRQIENKYGLTLEHILDFLYETFLENRERAVVGFYLSYDWGQWLKQLPEDRARLLFTRKGMAQRTPTKGGRAKSGRRFPVRWGKWDMDMLPDRRLSIRKRHCSCDTTKTQDLKECTSKHAGPWLHICDAGPFFQSSFLKVINPKNWKEPICTTEEYEAIKEGKEKRSTAMLDDDMRYYNRLENEIFARVMSRLNEGLCAIDVRLDRAQWYGPGQAAHAWLRSEGVVRGARLADVTPEWALEAARKSYFGGWFEIMAHGLIPGITYGYDINSAYPYQIAQLPCLEHGTWSRGSRAPDLGNHKDSYWLVNVTVKSGEEYIGSMLHREKDGRILRPMQTAGWYWLHELKAAVDAKCVTEFHIKEWIRYDPCDCFSPVRRIANLYAQRLAVGKDSILGMAARLVYNSSYGKFAQSVGTPAYANPIYASLITAGCRTQILEAIASHPGGKANVVMVATDAVYFLDPHPNLHISKKLGDWSASEKHNLTLFKPGVYWDDKAREALAQGKLPAFKARGINVRDFSSQILAIDKEFASWTKDKSPHVYVVYNKDGTLKGRRGWPEFHYKNSFSVVSPVQAIETRHNWTMAGILEQNVELTQTTNPYQKRTGLWYDPQRRIFRSRVSIAGNGQKSVPYDKRFGLENSPFSFETKNSLGTNPDGLVGDIFSFMVRSMTEGE